MIFFLTFSLAAAKLILPNQLTTENQKLKTPSATPITLDFTCKKVTDPIFNINPSFTPLIYSGYLSAPEGTNSAVSFIFYGAKSITDPTKLSSVPTIIWLQGGPGGSSQIGNFLEVGPYKFTYESSNLEENNNSWHQNYNLLFVDQPVGVGFGYAQDFEVRPTNQQQIAEQFYNALVEFTQSATGCVQLFNLAGLDKSIWFLFGESYAGKYIPNIAKQILQQAQNKGKLSIQLKGLGYGDGFTDPPSVVKQVSDFGYSLALIDGQERIQANQMAFQALYQIRNKDWLDAQESLTNTLNFIKEAAGHVNIYNMFQYVQLKPLDNKVLKYLTTPAVVKALQFNENVSYQTQDNECYIALGKDFMESYVETVEWLLNEGTEVILYSGQNDLIVPTPATVSWIEQLNWKNSQTFYNTNYTDWVIGNQIVGLKKKAANLQFQIVFNAGHLGPHDQPENVYNLMDTFIKSIVN